MGIDWNLISFAVALVVIAAVLWALRWGIKALVERAAQAAYDRRIEQLRSELRAREASLTGLQNALLRDRSGRVAIIEQRRVEALEAIWKEVVRLRPAMSAVTAMQMFKYDVIAERAQSEPKLREVIGMIRGKGTLDMLGDTSVDLSRPFVSTPVWASFTAYRSVMIAAVAAVELLTIGVEEPQKLFKQDYLVDMVKAALPGSVTYLERVGASGVYFLTEQLNDLVLTAVRAALDGKEDDEGAVARASNIIDLASKAEAARATAMLGESAS